MTSHSFVGASALPTVPGNNTDRWTDCLEGASTRASCGADILVGVLPGEGVGPEVTGCSVEVLKRLAEATGLRAKVETGGPIGRDAEQTFETALPDEVIAFCQDIFARGGAVLSGPGGGRYVYDIRKCFDLFFKISPLRTAYGAPDASPLKSELLEGVDILITRENTGGAYQGLGRERSTLSGERIVEHHLSYAEGQVRRFLTASARLARTRRGHLTDVWKESGLNVLSGLWRDCARHAAAAEGVELRLVDIDLMTYRLIREPACFDVIAAPNLFGDVLADLGAVLLGSRGVSFSGNYTEDGAAVYQTNHGAAYDLAGADRANPAGQLFSLAMMLRESFGLVRESEAIERAVCAVWTEGWRTADVVVTGSRVLGTREMARRVADTAARMVMESSGRLR